MINNLRRMIMNGTNLLKSVLALGKKVESQEIKQVCDREEVLGMIDRFIIRKDEKGSL